MIINHGGKIKMKGEKLTTCLGFYSSKEDARNLQGGEIDYPPDEFIEFEGPLYLPEGHVIDIGLLVRDFPNLNLNHNKYEVDSVRDSIFESGSEKRITLYRKYKLIPLEKRGKSLISKIFGEK